MAKGESASNAAPAHARPVGARAMSARLVDAMAHELLTPLNAIISYSALMRDGLYGPLSSRQRRVAGRVITRARDLQTLIDGLLALALLDRGCLAAVPTEFDPAAVLDQSRRAIAPLARAKRVVLHVRCAPIGIVCTDRTHYTRIVYDLLTNAVKFTPAGGRVEVTADAGDEPTFVTRVRDTGIGIARRDRARVFERFRQLDDGLTRRYRGLGLGLTLVRRLARLLGGQVRLRSAPGHGTCVAVTLPRRLAMSRPTAPLQRQTVPTRS